MFYFIQLMCFDCEDPQPTFTNYQLFRAHLRVTHNRRAFLFSDVLDYQAYEGAIQNVIGLPSNAQQILYRHGRDNELESEIPSSISGVNFGPSTSGGQNRPRSNPRVDAPVPTPSEIVNQMRQLFHGTFNLCFLFVCQFCFFVHLFLSF